MANQEKKQQGNFFDSMMFGGKDRVQETIEEPEEKGEEKQLNDSKGTTETLIETYQQLSPYFKEVSNMLKKFKK